MADLTPAEVGDKISEKTQKILGSRTRRTPTEVKPKAPGANGRWVDIDDGYFAQNNSDAWNHAESYPKHRWAWMNAETGDLEVP